MRVEVGGELVANFSIRNTIVHLATLTGTAGRTVGPGVIPVASAADRLGKAS